MSSANLSEDLRQNVILLGQVNILTSTVTVGRVKKFSATELDGGAAEHEQISGFKDVAEGGIPSDAKKYSHANLRHQKVDKNMTN